MKKIHKKRLIQTFAASTLVLVVLGFSVSSIAFALIPNWTQESKFSCFPSESPTEPIPALIQGLKK